MNDTPDRTESIFAAAVALATAAERAAYLEQACAGDAGLRGRVEALLRAHERAGHLLDRPAAPRGLVSTGAYTPNEQSGTLIAGRYKLLEEIGEGGMGTVWVAEQTQPVKRKVAIKLIKAGMDSKSVVARFEAERQALAVMDHPNIAKVLDGGLTETGRPYFVMEYVKGVPITEYCDAARLNVSERLNLFVQVCQAVQHAHQKGIIHRDLKPSNILVAPYDDKPVPKVIDFGLAKAMHQSLTEKTLHTAHETVLGTPLYMSPEQAQLNNLDVDTRSDIYSLGVLLYELLTGTTPLEKQRFKEAAWEEVRRIIREEEPPRPSARLSSTATLPSLAAGRQTEPARLTSLVRGDLDWIVMKSLEKDRNRRYETANGFAADVLRHLAGEPVLAAPPSARYRLRKFIRKHRAALLTAAALVVLLVAGVAVSAWQAVRATRAEADALAQRDEKEDARAAEEAQRKQAEAQRNRATTAEKEAKEQAAIAQAVNDFLNQDVLAQASPNQQPDRDIKLRTVLDRAAQRIAGRFDNQPLVEAGIRRTLGETYFALGEYDAAQSHLQQAAALYRRQCGDEHPDTLRTLDYLGDAYDHQGKHLLALPLFEQVLATRRRLLGAEHPDTLTALSNLADWHMGQGQFDRAEKDYLRVLEARRRLLGEEHPDTRLTLFSLGMLYSLTRKFAEAESLLKKAVTLAERARGADHPETLGAQGMLGFLYWRQGRYDVAEPLLTKSLEDYTRIVGPEHRDTFTAMHNLALLYGRQKKFKEAEALYIKALAGRRRILGEDDLQTGESLHSLESLYQQQKQYGQAEQLLTEALENHRRKNNSATPRTLKVMTRLATVHRSQGKHAEAQELLRQILEVQRRDPGPDHPDTLMSMNNLAAAYWSAKQLDKSIPLFEETLQRQEATQGRGHPSTLRTVANLGVNYMDAGRLAEAMPLLEEAHRAAKQHSQLSWISPRLLDAYAQAKKSQEAAALANELLVEARKSLPPDSPQLTSQLTSLGGALLRAKAFTEAEPLLRECLAIREKTQPDVWNTFNAQSLLGGALLGQKKYAEAEPLLLNGYEGMKQREKTIPPSSKARLTEALQRLFDLSTPTNRPAEAAKWQRELDAHKATAKPSAKP